MSKKNRKPNSDNPYDLIAQVSLTVKDKGSDNPCRFKLRATTFRMDYKKRIPIPERFEVITSGVCSKKKYIPYVQILDKIGKFIKTSFRFGRKHIDQRRKEAIAVMVDAYRENPDMFDIRFKVIPVRGNSDDYSVIYNFFGIPQEETKRDDDEEK